MPGIRLTGYEGQWYGGATQAARARLPFRAVNRRDQPGHQKGMQRHHLLPLQLLGQTGLRRMFDALGGATPRFDDFRTNGLLLPASEEAGLVLGLPLHRDPLGRDVDFSALDAIAESLWQASVPVST